MGSVTSDTAMNGGRRTLGLTMVITANESPVNRRAPMIRDSTGDQSTGRRKPSDAQPASVRKTSAAQPNCLSCRSDGFQFAVMSAMASVQSELREMCPPGGFVDAGLVFLEEDVVSDDESVHIRHQEAAVG